MTNYQPPGGGRPQNQMQGRRGPVNGARQGTQMPIGSRPGTQMPMGSRPGTQMPMGSRPVNQTQRNAAGMNPNGNGQGQGRQGGANIGSLVGKIVNLKDPIGSLNKIVTIIKLFG